MAQAIVQSSCRKLRSAIGDEAIMRLNFTSDLQEMLELLVAIDRKIPDAKDWWMITDWNRWQYWLKEVEDTSYRVSYMVEELQEMTVPASGKKVAKMLAGPENTNVVVEPKSKKTMLDRMREIEEKLKMLSKALSKVLSKELVHFDDIADTIDTKELLQAPVAPLGREDDVEKIVARLSSSHSSEGPIIHLIHGLQGVGKATVAAAVFDNDRFKSYYRIWINHSRTLELYEIADCIISQLVPAGEQKTSGGPGPYADMVYIMNRLRELLNGKKILIVLHNLCADASQWKSLKDMLSVEDMGSTQVIVIATVDITEQDAVAIDFYGVQPHRIHPLTEEMCCRIIKQAAAKSADKEDWERVAPELAKFCAGIPMVAQVVCSVLQFKQYEEWTEIQHLDAFVTGPLQQCYRSMPPNLRLCFAYCVFVLDTERDIVKEDLIHQWIALNLIEPSDVFSTTQLAEQYLTRLLDMSLLQTAKSSRTSAKDDASAISLIMHDMVRLWTEDSLRDGLGEVSQGKRARYSEHCKYVVVFHCTDRLLKSAFADQNIRALRCLDCNHTELGDDDPFSFARWLRVLELYESSMQKLPESICQLRHLGYLKLSGWSELESLPESIGDLTNLLHIDLSACHKLENLPGSFGKLINLLYIRLSGSSKLEILPESVGELTNLVHINLSGSTALVHLPESFGRLINLVCINLSGCLALVDLPRSFGKLRKLEHINLSGCPNVVHLPGSFGKLINLKHINLSGCNGLKILPVSFGELTSLAHIDLSGCYGLEELPQSFGELTSLANINLSGCYGLDKLPESFGKLISLVHINLSGCFGLGTLPGSFGNLQNLLHVDLSRCYGLSKLPESFGKLGKLVHLDLSFWSCFEVIQTALDGLTNLQYLNLSNPCCHYDEYPRLEGLEQVLGQFIRLKHLNLSMFLNPIFCNQSEEENYEYIEFIGSLSRLKYLNLSHSIFLRYLHGNLADLQGLHTLDLSGCIRLTEVPSWVAAMPCLISLVLSNMESYTFEVGTDNVINNYGQLVDVRCKILSITSLNNMKSVEEARRIRLAEKHNLEMLSLCWSVSSQRTVEDNVLLAELVPPHSLQCLELKGYSSTCFPSWLTSSSILVDLVLADIPNCSRLPPLGLLPNLQRLALDRMCSITRIDAGELSGGSTAAFNRLSEFTIEDMSSLEEFTYHSSGGDSGSGSGSGEEFLLPVIDKLVLRRCPGLSFVPLPPRAQKLVIEDCNDVMVCWRNRVGRHGAEAPSACASSPVTEVTELVVENCRVYLSHWCLLNHLPGLRSLTIRYCNNLFCSPEIIGVLSSQLQKLCFSNCQQMSMLPEHLGGLTSLRELQIEYCSQFLYLPDSMRRLTFLESMHFIGCDSMAALPLWLGSLTSLQQLAIKKCKNIGSLPPSICELTKLKDLHILDCPSLKEWCEGGEGKKILGQIQPRIEVTHVSAEW